MKLEINKLKPNKDNPRVIKDDKFKKLVKSIKEFPEMLELRPIVVDEDMTILGGNMRHKACIEAGLKEVYIKVAKGLTDKQKEEFIVKDNVGFGEWEWDILANQWDSVQLTEWGLDVWINEDDKVIEGLIDDDVIPEVKESKVKRGDIWKLGEHRVMCGDSTSSDDVEKLMNGEKADMVFTDPPYGIGYEYNSHKDKKGKEYLEFCEKWFNVLLLFSDLIIITTGWSYKFFWWGKNPSDEMVWFDKTKQSGGRSYFLRKTEPIFIFGKIKEKYTWDIFENQSNRGDGIRELHTCPKPLSLISDIIKPQTKTNDLILDVFLGSGTTLIASEKLNRKCYGMELDEKYCDVIIERWEQYTGLKAEKI